MNPINKHYRNGSALLLTLLVMIGIGGIVLTSTRLVLESSRINANQDDYQIAARSAMSGLEVGLNLLKKEGLVDGSGNSREMPTYAQRFYTPTGGDTCSALTPLAVSPTPVEDGCSWYQISITGTYSITDSAGILLGDSDLPMGQGVKLTVSSVGVPTPYLQLPAVTAATVRCVPDPSTPAACTSAVYGQGQKILLGTGKITLTRTLNTGSLGAAGLTSDATGGIGRSITLVRSGYTCLSAIGHSGTTAVKAREVLTYASAPPAGSFTGVTMGVLQGSGCSDHLPEVYP